MEELQVDYVDGKFYVYLTLTENLEKAELTDDGYRIRVRLKSRKFEVKLPHQCKEIEKVEEVSPLMYLIVAKPRYPELLPSKPFTYEEEDDLSIPLGPHVEKVEDKTVLLVKKDELDEWIEKEYEKFEKELEEKWREKESRELEKTLLEEEEEEEEGYEFYEKPFEDDEDEWDQGVTELGYEEEL